jgi:hypothetical protein
MDDLLALVQYGDNKPGEAMRAKHKELIRNNLAAFKINEKDIVDLGD